MKAFLLALFSPLLLLSQTAIFPGAVAGTQHLGVASNRASTILAASIGASDTSFAVASAAGIAAPTVLTIDDERIHVCSVSANTYTVCSAGRGYDGSLAAVHAAPAKVVGNLVAAEWNQMVAEVIAAETRLFALGAGPFADATATANALNTKVVIAGDLSGSPTAPVVSKLRGTAVSATSPTDGQVLGYSAAGATWLPLSLAQQMDTRPLRTAALKPPNDAGATVAAGQTTTLASLTGAGTVESIQIATGTGTSTSNSLSFAACSEGGSEGGGLDSTLSITVDGTAVMTNVPLGIFYNFYGYNSSNTPTAPRFYQTAARTMDYYVAHAGMGANRRILIHYTTSLVITWTNTSPCSQLMFSGIDYRAGAPPAGLYNPRYNKIHFTYTGFSTISGTVGTVITPLATQTPGSAGLLHAIDVFALQNGASQPTWLEGHVQVTVDGSASVAQKGTEDFFGSHYYFLNGLRGPETGQGFVGLGPATDGSASAYYVGVYRYFTAQPLTFATSLGITMENGHTNEGATSAILFTSLIVWYTTS